MTEARAQLSDLVSQVAFGGEPVMLTRHGKPLVALVPAALIEEAGNPDRAAPNGATVALDLTARHGQAQHDFGVAAHHHTIN